MQSDAIPPLQAEGLTLRLGGRRVVDAVSLVLRSGEWVALVGPNGAGKSTLLQLLAGLRDADGGSVRLGGRALQEWPGRERAQRLAWLSQQGEADGDIAARDVVRLGRLPRHGLFGAPDAGDEIAVSAAMAETACAELAARRLSELSGGERQRVLLARALAVQAPVTFRDGPRANLDPPHQTDWLHTVRALVAAGGTVVSVLHEISIALQADDMLIMAAGRIAHHGPCQDGATHAALEQVFERRIQVRRIDGMWMALPRV